MRARPLTRLTLLIGASCTVAPLNVEGKRCTAADPCPTGFSCVFALNATEGRCLKGDGGIVFEACIDAGVTAPTAETCNGVDDDCDGRVDALADGGALRDGRPCERLSGVCASATHACRGGAYEATCGAASYGPAFEPLETRCDGLDNDCDGRPDVSRPVELLGTPSDGFVWFSVDGGFVAFTVTDGGMRDARRVVALRFGPDLNVEAPAVELAVDTVTEVAASVSARRLGDDFVVTWLSVPAVCSVSCPPSKVMLARVGADGAHRWTPDGGATPAAVRVAQGQVLAAPAVALSSDGGQLMVVWSELDGGIFAARVSAGGVVLTPSMRLAETCEPSLPPVTPALIDVIADESTGGFLGAWENRVDAGQAVGASDRSLAFVRLDANGGVVGGRCMGEPVLSVLRLFEGPLAVWQAPPAPPALMPSPLRVLRDPLTTPAPLILPTGIDAVRAVDVLPVDGGHLVGWASNGMLHLRFFSPAGMLGTTVDLGAADAEHLSLARGPQGQVAVGWVESGSRQPKGLLACER